MALFFQLLLGGAEKWALALFYGALNEWARWVLLRLLTKRKVCNIIVGECMRFGRCPCGTFIFLNFASKDMS